MKKFIKNWWPAIVAVILAGVIGASLPLWAGMPFGFFMGFLGYFISIYLQSYQ